MSAVVVFADKMATGSLMHAAKARNNTAGLVWIGSDAWSSRETVVNGVEDVIEVRPDSRQWRQLGTFLRLQARLLS